MLRFLGSLFTSTQEQPSAFDDALIEKAIDRAVAGTDHRIRALSDYKKLLREPVVKAMTHVIELVDALPPPVPISPQSFSESSTIRSLFVSKEHLSKVVGGFNSIRDYLSEVSVLPPDDIFGLLTMAQDERKVFGMELDGENLRRDVLQVAVNFSSHRFIGIKDNEVDSRRELKIRAFDFLLQKTLERIANQRSNRVELDRQRRLLQQKLDAMKAGQWGLGAMMNDSESVRPKLATLEEKINSIDAELGLFSSDKLSLEQSLSHVIDTLSNPQDWLSTREIRLRLDYRGIKLDDASSAPANEITLTELYSCTGEKRSVLLGRIASSDIPEQTDIWNAAKIYL